MPAKNRWRTGKQQYLYTMTLVLYAILAYLLFQFVFRFVVPLFIATRRFKKGFREMKSRMEQEQQPGYQSEPQKSRPAPRQKTGEYIDFEEVK